LEKIGNQEVFQELKTCLIQGRACKVLSKKYMSEWKSNPEIIGICLGYRLKNMYQGAGYSGKILVKQIDTFRK
jgi:hypothetical protein